jgi:hypothetical protein
LLKMARAVWKVELPDQTTYPCNGQGQ